MLSYKHVFHAGNFADVLKHLCWLDTIDYLGKKNKPFTLYDTHSGAGQYSLTDEAALKNREFDTGIGALGAAQLSDPLARRYLTLCQPYLSLNIYPGSPLIALEALEREESVQLFELHPNEYDLLKKHVSAFCHAHPHQRDGFEGLLALTPPANKRGAVLIDPPYERKQEYSEVIETVEKVYKRWRQAQIVVWFPKLSKRAGDKSGASEKMVRKLAELADSAFYAELCIAPDSADAGMYGTGVLMLNPPWQSDQRVSAAMNSVMPHMPAGATFTCHWLKRAD